MSDSSDQQGDSAANVGAGHEPAVPKAVVNRLSLYLRAIQYLIADGQHTVSSTQLGTRLGLTDAQVRKDLAFFGQFGYPGIGYRCAELAGEIKRIVGTDRTWNVCLVGLGNLGSALISHRGFAQQGFSIAAVFEVESEKIGQTSEGVTVYDFADLATVVVEKEIKLGIIAVPATAAQNVADALVAAGVDGVLNFAPVTISVPDVVSKVAVDLAIELEKLTFAVVNRP
jgi:redox-sensing transcriptional repressor